MDAKTFYEQIAPELDPGGFKLYFTAQRLTGFELYKQFPYEDSRGMFEMMNGHQLMRYLLADGCRRPADQRRTGQSQTVVCRTIPARNCLGIVLAIPAGVWYGFVAEKDGRRRMRNG